MHVGYMYVQCFKFAKTCLIYSCISSARVYFWYLLCLVAMLVLKCETHRANICASFDELYSASRLSWTWISVSLLNQSNLCWERLLIEFRIFCLKFNSMAASKVWTLDMVRKVKTRFCFILMNEMMSGLCDRRSVLWFDCRIVLQIFLVLGGQ